MGAPVGAGDGGRAAVHIAPAAMHPHSGGQAPDRGQKLHGPGRGVQLPRERASPRSLRPAGNPPQRPAPDEFSLHLPFRSRRTARHGACSVAVFGGAGECPEVGELFAVLGAQQVAFGPVLGAEIGEFGPQLLTMDWASAEVYSAACCPASARVCAIRSAAASAWAFATVAAVSLRRFGLLLGALSFLGQRGRCSPSTVWITFGGISFGGGDALHGVESDVLGIFPGDRLGRDGGLGKAHGDEPPRSPRSKPSTTDL